MSLCLSHQDYGFHPPTCSWPISTCMLIEPTESETLEEVDRYAGLSASSVIIQYPSRFCDAMIQIRKEAEEIITGKQPKESNLLKNAPHPVSEIALTEEKWNRFVCLLRPVYPMLMDVLQPIFSVERGIPPAMASKKEVLAYSLPHR